MEKITVGLHETLRAADEGKLSGIILAEDTDTAFKTKVKAVAAKYNIPVESATHSAELGRRAGIEVKAGVLGILK